jgi:hypothetical protein
MNDRAAGAGCGEFNDELSDDALDRSNERRRCADPTMYL